MLVQDWQDLFDEFYNTSWSGRDWPSNLKRKSKMEIAVKDDDKLEFKDGKLYITKEGLGSTLSISCDKWKDVIDAIAEGAANEEKRKREEEANKAFVNDLVFKVKKSIADCDKNFIVSIAFSDKAYDLLEEWENPTLSAWQLEYNVRKMNLPLGVDYKIFYYDSEHDTICSRIAF
jgi:hypothetical protein